MSKVMVKRFCLAFTNKESLVYVVTTAQSKRFRSTSSKYDIVIIGGGPIGLSIAYHCSLKKLGKIAIIERDKSYQSGSASFSAGGIRQQFSVKENILMSMYGAEFIKNSSNLAVEGDLPDLQFHENGYLFLAGNNKGKDILEQNNKLQRSCGADWIHLMSPEQLSNAYPWLNVEGLTIGSGSNSNEGYFDPWALICSLKRKVSYPEYHTTSY